MNKTYWWRISISIVSLVVIFLGYLSIYAYEIGICSRGANCSFGYNPVIDSILYLAISTLLVSLITFFVLDKVFKSWFKFYIVWIIITIIFIYLAPTYSSGVIANSPTKEIVSIWMSVLFVIISIISFIVQTKKLKK